MKNKLKDCKKVYSKSWNRASEILKNDGVVVLPTDTLYGILGSALSKKAVRKIYEIKGRDETKPFIVLVNSFSQLEIFGIKIDEIKAKILEKFWPGKVSVILPCQLKKFEYLHLGGKSIAFRMIGKRNKNLFKLISLVGPVVAPSVNKQGEKPAETISEARAYFLDKIQSYINVGKRVSKPSTLIRLEGEKIVVLRQGEVKV
jgi:L-threonylcarbamoyladenylate synthase